MRVHLKKGRCTAGLPRHTGILKQAYATESETAGIENVVTAVAAWNSNRRWHARGYSKISRNIRGMHVIGGLPSYISYLLTKLQT